MLADGLVRATDNAPDGSEEFFAQIRPANPGDGTDGAWTLGYIQSRYLILVRLFDTHAQMVLYKKVLSQASTEIAYFAEPESRGKIGYFAVV